MENNVLFSSFEHSYYEILRQRSDIEFKFLADEQKDIDKLIAYDYTNYSIGCNSLLGTKENIDKFHNKKAEVSVYFHPDCSISDKKLGDLLDNGVDHFFVDTPLEGTAILNKYYEKL